MKLFLIFFLLMVMEMPIAFALGTASILSMTIFFHVPLSVAVQNMFTSNDSFPLMAVPFFMLAGVIMEVGGISRRLVNFASALVGFVHGGLAHVTVLASMFFAGISGAAAADAAAVGTLMIPEMKKRGYETGFACAIQAAGGTIGVIIPPSIPMVIFGVLSSTSIGGLFLGGVLPGILLGLSLMMMSYFIVRRKGRLIENRFSIRKVWETFREALWALGMPAIIVGGIVSGAFTATESAVVAVDYALLVGFLVYKELTLRDLPGMFIKAAVTSAMVMFIIANASVLGWVLAFESIPQIVTNAFLSLSNNPVVLLLLINVLLLIVGCFIETASALIIFVPLLIPLIPHLGISAVQFGVVVVFNLAIGMLTPPMGICLFVACSIGGATMEQISRAVMPFLLIMLVDLLVITFVPFFTTLLPALLIAN